MGLSLKENVKGQGLVELIVAIAVIEIGLFSVWSLFLTNFNAEKESEMRIIGANLSREGIELVKNIRDSNWLRSDQGIANNGEPVVWDSGLADGNYSASYDRDDLDDAKNSQLYFDQVNGFYTNSGNGTKISPYKRTIGIKSICCADANNDFKCDDTNYKVKESGGCGLRSLRIGIDVVAETAWKYNGSDRNAIVEDMIYNWR